MLQNPILSQIVKHIGWLSLFLGATVEMSAYFHFIFFIVGAVFVAVVAIDDCYNDQGGVTVLRFFWKPLFFQESFVPFACLPGVWKVERVNRLVLNQCITHQCIEVAGIERLEVQYSFHRSELNPIKGFHFFSGLTWLGKKFTKYSVFVATFVAMIMAFIALRSWWGIHEFGPSIVGVVVIMFFTFALIWLAMEFTGGMLSAKQGQTFLLIAVMAGSFAVLWKLEVIQPFLIILGTFLLFCFMMQLGKRIDSLEVEGNYFFEVQVGSYFKTLLEDVMYDLEKLCEVASQEKAVENGLIAELNRNVISLSDRWDVTFNVTDLRVTEQYLSMVHDAYREKTPLVLPSR